MNTETTKEAPPKPAAPVPVPRLLVRYRNEIRPALQKAFGYRNLHAAPRLVKISVNSGLGRSLTEEKRLKEGVGDLARITGQQPRLTRAKKSVAAFRLREGMAIGAQVTLRRARMYEFLDRLISIAIPRIRDFRGLDARGFDRQGNYTMGIAEQLIFPEIPMDKVEFVQGMAITIVTTAKTGAEGLALLQGFGMPFREGK